MISDAEQIRTVLVNTTAQDPREFWESLGIDVQVVLELAESGQQAAFIQGVGVPAPFVAAAMQIGAILAREGMRSPHLDRTI